ncbi:MAG: hypothetical protein PHP57_06420 [Sideroxydans sp.]|nr:hypothetical protein [Sideroxydans sp.]
MKLERLLKQQEQIALQIAQAKAEQAKQAEQAKLIEKRKEKVSKMILDLLEKSPTVFLADNTVIKEKISFALQEISQVSA